MGERENVYSIFSPTPYSRAKRFPLMPLSIAAGAIYLKFTFSGLSAKTPYMEKKNMKEKVKATIVNKWRYRNIDKDFLDVVNAIEDNKDSDLIVFPECCLVEFNGRKDYENKINRLKDISLKYEIIICVGLEEPVYPTDASRNILYNSAFLIEGNKLHKYIAILNDL